jgi:hypothetical protein
MIALNSNSHHQTSAPCAHTDLHGLPSAPGEDGCHQPGSHIVSWLVGGFASVVVPGIVGMLTGLL